MAEIIGSAAQGRIVLAAPISLAEIEARFADRIEAREEVTFDPPSASLRGRRLRRLGAIALAEQPVAVAADEPAARTLAAGIARIGLDRLPWSKALSQWRDRVLFLRRSEGEEWPDLSDAGLAARIDDWLTPVLVGKTALAQLGTDELADALVALLPYNLRRRLDAEAPTHFEAPSGSRVPIDYEAEEGPKLAIRVQELFGLGAPSDHRGRPGSAGDRAPVPGPPARAGHPRPARLLARQLRGGAQRDARPLPAPSLARRPAVGAGHAARQAARYLAHIPAKWPPVRQ